MNVLTGHWVSSCHSVMVTYFSWIEVLGVAGRGIGGGLGEQERKRRRGEETKNKRYFFFFAAPFLVAELPLNQTLVMFGVVAVAVGGEVL